MPLKGSFSRFLVLLLSCFLCCFTHQLPAQPEKMDSLLALVEYAETDSARLEVYWDMYQEIRETDIQGSIHLIEQVIHYAEAINDNRAWQAAQFEHAIQKYYAGDQKSAAQTLRNLFNSGKLERQNVKNSAYSLMASIFLELNKADSAFLFHELAMKEIDSNSVGFSMSLYNLSIAKAHFGSMEEALQLANEALEIAEAAGAHDQLPSLLLGVFTYENAINGRLPDHAEERLREALEDIENQAIIAGAYYNIATFYMEAEHYEEARKLLALAEAASNGDENYFTESIDMAYADLDLQEGNPARAIAQLRQIDAQTQTRETWLLQMMEAFAALDRPDSTVRYARLYSQYVESKNAAASAKAIEAAESSLKVVRAEIAMKKLESDRQLLEERNGRQALAIIALGTSLLLLASLAYLIINRIQRKRRAKEAELRERKNKMTELSLTIARKNEWIASIDHKLKEHKTNDSNIIDQLTRDLKSQTALEKDWDRFMRYFNDQNEGFYERLKALYPAISDKDLRLCTLIRLRMSTKEIATLLNLSTESVKSSRHRLRKKMSLPPETRLSDHLAGV